MSEAKKQHIESLTIRYWPVIVLTTIAILLIVVSFILPPSGAIDNSVLAASGEIFAFAALLTFIVRAERGADFTIRKGDLEVSIHNDDDHHDRPRMEMIEEQHHIDEEDEI